MKQDFTIPVPQPPGRRRLFRPWPRFTSAALLIALGSGLAVFTYQCKTRWTPLQRAYFPAYVRTAHAAPAQRGHDPQAHLFSLLVITYPRDTRIALESDVVILPSEAGSPYTATFFLSPTALKEGARRLEWRSWRLEDAKLHAWLAHWVYDDRGPWQLLRNAWFTMLLSLALTLPLAVPKDFADHRTWHLRRALTRAGLVSRSQFHRCARHHRGIGWLTTNPASLWERIFVNPSERRRVRIPAQHETEHVLIVGDGGTGKSSILRQLLVQVQDRNETAIIYDPAMEYVPQFLSPDRGDVILNPLDERMPYWDLADELEDRDKAEAIARSLIPHRETQDRFLVEAPRQILAHLLKFCPSARQLSGWIANPESEIDDRVFGTPMEGFISRDKPRERGRVLAVLGRVRNILDVLPPKSRTRHWTTTRWAERREGWVFVTTLPSMRETLQPLVNLWLDLLLSTLARQTDCSVEPVWVVIDDPTSPSNLRMAPNAIWESRRSNSRFVLALKSRSEPPRSYGHDIKAELSHFGTKIFLRTKDPQAANWVAGCVGSGHAATSRTTNTFDTYHSNDASDDRHRERAVLVSTIGSLENLEGFLQMPEFLLKITFRYAPPGKHQPAFVPLASTDSPTGTPTQSTTLGGFPAADEDVQAEDSRTDLSLNKRTSDRRHPESQLQDQLQPVSNPISLSRPRLTWELMIMALKAERTESGMSNGVEVLLTSKEAAQVLKIHPKVLERMAKRGEVPALKVGKFWRYRATTLDAWINSRLQSGRQPCRMET